MRERCDSSAGTRSTANVLRFCDAKRSRRHTCKHPALLREVLRSSPCGDDGACQRTRTPVRSARRDGIAIVARSADRVQCGVRSVISAAPKARKARGGHVPKQGEKKHLEMRCFLAPVEGLEPPTLRLTAACSTG